MAFSSGWPISLKQTPTCCISESFSRNLLHLLEIFIRFESRGEVFIHSRLFANVQNYSNLFFVQDLNVIVLRQSVPHSLRRDKLSGDLRDNLGTRADLTASQQDYLSNRMQISYCNTELIVAADPMCCFQLRDWKDAFVLRDGLDGLEEYFVGFWYEDGVLLEDGCAYVL